MIKRLFENKLNSFWKPIVSSSNQNHFYLKPTKFLLLMLFNILDIVILCFSVFERWSSIRIP